MKFCTKCGKELFDEAVICPACGCACNGAAAATVTGTPSNDHLLLQLSQRINTNAIIWLVIGILQCFSGVGIICGAWNIYSAINDKKYSKAVLENPVGIVARFEPVTGAIITLVLNLVIGGVVGVIGSIYYFVSIRGFVLENRAHFDSLGATEA